MKFREYNGRIYLVTKEYSDFHMSIIEHETRITPDTALRLLDELSKIVGDKPEGTGR